MTSWGPPIQMCGQPSWLSDDEKIDIENADGIRWYSDGTDGLGVSARWIGWGTKPITIRVRADHPYYRSVQPAAAKPAEIDAALADRMMAFARKVSDTGSIWYAPEINGLFDEARAIVAELPEPVDPELAAAKAALEECGFAADHIEDDSLSLQIALAAIKRGRQLEREAK